MDEGTAHQQRQRVAGDEPEVQNGDGTRQLLVWEQVRQHRVGRGTAAGLPDAHAHACDEQLPEILRQPADGRHHAPDEEARAQDQTAAAAVDQACDRQSEDDVEQDEGEPDEITDLHVRQVEVALHRFDQQVENAAVQEVDGQRERENAHGIPGSSRAGPRRPGQRGGRAAGIRVSRRGRVRDSLVHEVHRSNFATQAGKSTVVVAEL